MYLYMYICIYIPFFGYRNDFFLRKGGYRAKNLVGIKETFSNISQETAEDRAEVTNLTDANIHFATNVSEQANHMATKVAAM